MKKKPSKPNAPSLVLASEEAMIGALNRHVTLSLALASAKAAHEKRIAKLNEEFDLNVQGQREELQQLESSLQLFCELHPEMFADKKSREYANAVIGFRTSPPAVGKRITKDTFEAIALRFQEVSDAAQAAGETDWAAAYIQYEGPILDKKALLRDCANLSTEQLAKVGIVFTQAENFFIEPKADAVERVTKESEVRAA